MNKQCNNLIVKIVNTKMVKGLIRYLYIKQTIANIGKIVETEDSITCYVDQKKFDKNKKYDLPLNGMNVINKESRNLVNKLNLNKKVYYIFENISFDKNLSIHSSFSHIIFKNCIFSTRIRVSYANSITFENNQYQDWYPKDYGNGEFYIDSDELKFINDDFSNYYYYICERVGGLGMNITSNNLEIINSKIITDKGCKINIKAKNTTIKDSTISSSEIYIDSKSIKSNSRFEATNGIIIDSNSHELENAIFDSPTLIINGVEIPTDNSKTNIITTIDKKQELINARIELVEYLKKLRDTCNEKTVSKVLKRR